MSKITLLALVITLAFTSFAAAKPAEPEPEQFQLGDRIYTKSSGFWHHTREGVASARLKPGCLIVRAPDGREISQQTMSSLGIQQIHALALGYYIVAVVDQSSEFEKAGELDQLGYYVEFDAVAELAGTPNDTYYRSRTTWPGQWNVEWVEARLAWGTTATPSNVVVAVIDSGVEDQHPDLQPTLWVNHDEIADNGIDDDGNGYVDDLHGWNFDDGNADPQPGSNGHGTSVAGIILAKRDNFIGIAGIASGSKLMNLRIGANLNTGQAELYAAMEYAAKNGADVANVSVTTLADPQWARDLVDHLTSTYDTIFVCAAGNSPFDGVRFPAAYDGTIAVGKGGDQNIFANSGSFGPELDLVAPTGVVTTDLTGDAGFSPAGSLYFWNLYPELAPAADYNPAFGGSSASAPHVTATVALMLAARPHLTAAEAKTILQETAVQEGGFNYNWNSARPGHSLEFGHGYLNAFDAVQQAKGSPDPHIPLLSFETPVFFPDTVRFQTTDLTIEIHNTSDTTVSHDQYFITVINDQNTVFKLQENFFDDVVPGSNKIWVPRNGSAIFTLRFQPLSYNTTYTGRVRLHGAGVDYYIELEGSTAPCC